MKDEMPGADGVAGFIEPFAFNCNYKDDRTVDVQSVPGSLLMKRIDPVDRTLVRMSDVSGISSSAVVQGFYEAFVKNVQNIPLLGSSITKIVDNDVAPTFQYWAPKRVKEDLVLSGDSYAFCDGGAFDNTCAISLLRRGVKNIAICYTNNIDPISDSKAVANNMYDIQALFGKAAPTDALSGVDIKNYNNMRKVFNPADWDKIITDLKGKRAQGDTDGVLFYPGMTVLDNPKCGIKAYKPNILFVFNNVAATAASPPLTDLFKPKSVDSDFPYIPVTFMSYDSALVDKLSTFSCENLKKSANATKFLEGIKQE
jgi:hypothetical protein